MVEKVTNATIERIKNLQWNKIFNMYYMEPVVFILVFAHSLSGTIMRNEVIYQACTTVFHYNESDCRQLGNKNLTDYLNKIETEIQPYVANLFMMRTLLESVVPAICGVFIGSWSDHYGRKPLLVISMIGFSFTYVIAAVVCEISRYYIVNPWYYILSVIPHSLLGGNCVFSVAIFCFISDITDTKTRPYRMIFMEVFFFVGLMSGSLLSSYVLAATSATATFSISGVVNILGTLFIIIYVPESLHIRKREEAQAEKDREEDIKTTEIVADINYDGLQMCIENVIDADEKVKPSLEAGKTQIDLRTIENGKDKKDGDVNKKIETPSVENAEEKRKTAGLFSYVHIKDMLNTCFKERPCYDRSIIWLVTGTMFLAIFIIDGAMTVFYLFVREKFHWSVRDFSFFETASHMVPMFGALVGFLVLRKVFKLSVVTIAILAFFSDILGAVMKGVASEPWHLYLSVVLCIFKSLGGPMCRTIVSNIVPATDLGKIFSIKNILQSIAPFLAAPLYAYIYKESLTTFPGLFNIVSAFLYFIAFVFLIIVYRFKYVHKERYAVLLK